eukprot:snap_masked-scaffold_3-processed-gene-18.42-mRNA-1 protein AED:0.12 eAED:0.12 QI:0/0/0/0.5/1/1/2/0/133
MNSLLFHLLICLFSFTFVSSETHYGNPLLGCGEDEVQIQLPGTEKQVCALECSHFVCPTDKPEDVTAEPTCALLNKETKHKFCALVCTGKVPGECGPEASCHNLGEFGVCFYDEEEKSKYKFLRAANSRIVNT